MSRSSFGLVFFSLIFLGSRVFRPNTLRNISCMFCSRDLERSSSSNWPYHTTLAHVFGSSAALLSFVFPCYCPFLLASDQNAQRPPRLRDCYSRVSSPNIDDFFQSSPAGCLRYGSPVMVVYTSLTTLAPVFDTVAAFSA